MDQIIAQLARRPDPNLSDAERLQVVEVRVDAARLLAGVGEDSEIEPELAVGFAGQQEECGRLDPRTEVQDVVFCHALCRTDSLFLNANSPANIATLHRSRSGDQREQQV